MSSQKPAHSAPKTGWAAKMMLNGKGLAGYVLTKDGKRLAFAAYVNHVSLAPDPELRSTWPVKLSENRCSRL